MINQYIICKNWENRFCRLNSSPPVYTYFRGPNEGQTTVEHTLDSIHMEQGRVAQGLLIPCCATRSRIDLDHKWFAGENIARI